MPGEFAVVFGVGIGHHNNDRATSLATAESEVEQASSVAQGEGAGNVDAIMTPAGLGEECLDGEHGVALVERASGSLNLVGPARRRFDAPQPKQMDD